MSNTKPCKHCRVDKPLEEFYKHSQMADGHINVCIPCRDTYVKAWSERNRDARRKIAREWSQRNRTPERSAEAWQKWYQVARVDSGQVAKINARVAARLELVARATPSWANHFFIEEAYELAKKRSQVTGVRWEVDHIVPIKSDRVCGLHVEHNLRVIPKLVNISKKNYHWPDSGPCWYLG